MHQLHQESTNERVNNRKIGSCNGRILCFSSANIKLLTCIKLLAVHSVIFCRLFVCARDECLLPTEQNETWEFVCGNHHTNVPCGWLVELFVVIVCFARQKPSLADVHAHSFIIYFSFHFFIFWANNGKCEKKMKWRRDEGGHETIDCDSFIGSHTTANIMNRSTQRIQKQNKK